jgi:segregation and condensation protein B
MQEHEHDIETSQESSNDIIAQAEQLPETLVGAEIDEDNPLEAPLMPVDADTLRAQVEALVFASPDPIQPIDIVNLLQGMASLSEVELALQDLVDFYAQRRGGFTLEHLYKMGYQFRTKEEFAPLMERQFASRPRPLSRSALETLSIIAYRQPTTRAEIEYIRGVDAGSIIKNLMERNLITCVGRKEEVGRPMLFGTTDEFLKVFHLPSLKDLPPLQSFQPPPEVMEQNSELSTAPESVDIEDFMGEDDPVRETETSPETEETVNFTDSGVDDSQKLQDSSDFSSTKAAEEHDRETTSTEMVERTGDSVEETSRDVDH